MSPDSNMKSTVIHDISAINFFRNWELKQFSKEFHPRKRELSLGWSEFP